MLTKAASVLAIAGAALANPIERRVPTGTTITSCTVPGVVALTFDDGPYAYTASALDQLNAAGFKGTFFFNGDNWASIYDYAGVVQRVKNEGHQLGSHTWSHADLGTLDAAGVTSQLSQLETAFSSILGGVWPNYLRPPYLSMSSTALSVAGQRGYKVISVDIDTLDWANTGNPSASLANFKAGLDAGGSISLEHDVHATTVQTLLPMLIQELKNRGLRSVTVGECLGEAASGWYSGSGSTTPPTTTNPGTTPTGLPISTDATCGAAAGYRCPANNCCSQYGWCGTSVDHCTNGCQPLYGICS